MNHTGSDLDVDGVDHEPAPGEAVDDARAYVPLDGISEAALEAALGPVSAAPRLTPDEIDAKILGEQYHRFPGTTVTVCCLTLANGFNVVGHSACASPENFNAAIGERIARANARDAVWPLEGYALCERISSGSWIKGTTEKTRAG